MRQKLATGCAPYFAVGQVGRLFSSAPVPCHNFVGLIDEVRISGVARSATQMMFGPAPAPAATPSSAPAARPSGNDSAPVLAAAPPEAAPTTNTVAHSAIIRGPRDKKRLAIVFSCRDTDDGASTILSTLRWHRAKASFFLTSDFLGWTSNFNTARTMVADGHFVGPESDGWGLGRPETAASATKTISRDIEAHRQQLTSLGIDPKNVHYFLPTDEQAGAEASAEQLRGHGLTMFGGTPGTLAFAVGSAKTKVNPFSTHSIFESIFEREREDKNGLNGFILVFRFDSSREKADRFCDHLGELLSALEARGYEFVRVDQLLDQDSGDHPPLTPAATKK
jgi:peptidoglycan/xylan/chitin deacetylase (PgdA/CDA1 family)